MKKITFIFILMLLIPITNVKGFYCTYTEIAQWKKIAYNVNYYYEYKENNGKVTFDITLSNLNKNIYFIDSTTGKKHEFTKNEVKLTGYSSGDTIVYTFYPVNAYCSDEPLYTIRINLPTYNQFYGDKLCLGIENYKKKKKWSSNNLTYEQFVKKIEQYKESLKEEDSNKEKTETNNTINYIVEFLINYYYMFIIGFTLLFIVIYFVKKKDNIYA